MPTTLGPPYQTNTLIVPPGMSLLDYAIWQRLREHLPTDVTHLYFNVRLGDGHDTPDDTTPDWKAYWLGITSKRADVILARPTETDLIELRDHASANAIGRLLMYQALWLQDPALTPPLILWLVTDTRDRDVATIAALHKINYLVI